MASRIDQTIHRRTMRTMAGVQAQKGGQDFEDWLEHSHNAYRQMGIALVEQLPVPTVPVSGRIAKFISHMGDKSLFRRVRTLARRQGYDYHGCFGPNAGPDDDLAVYHGQAIAMEAKSTSEETTSLPIIASDASGGGIREHQLQALAESYRDWGRVSALVWKNGEQRLVLRPSEILYAWERYRAGGRKSIPAREFTPFDVVDYPGYAQVQDWILPIREWMGAGRPSPGLSLRKAYSMIPYRLDRSSRTVTIDPEPGSGQEVLVIENVPPDQIMIDSIARASASAEDFAEKLKRLSVANEGTTNDGTANEGT